MASPEAPPRHACGCLCSWTDWLLEHIDPSQRPEWYRQLVTNRVQEGWWHAADAGLRCHVYENGRWRSAKPADDFSPDAKKWIYLDD